MADVGTTTTTTEANESIYRFLLNGEMTIILASFVCFALVFLFSAIASFGLRTYRRFAAQQKVFWNLAVARAAFGVFSTGAAIWYLPGVDWPIRPVDTTPQSTFIIQSCIGFFMFECMTLFTSNIVFRTFDVLLAAHHSMALADVCLCLMTGHAHTYMIMSLLFEISTPFTCVSWIFLKTGHADSRLWKLNQYAMIHAFHMRQALCYVFSLMLWRFWDDFAHVIHPSLTLLYISGLCLQMFVMNPYWLHKKTTQLSSPVDWNFNPAAATAVNGHIQSLNGDVNNTKTCSENGTGDIIERTTTRKNKLA